MTKKYLERKIKLIEHEIIYYSKVYPGSKKEKILKEKLRKMQLYLSII